MFYRKGDLYNQDLLQAGKDKLTELGIFSQVQVNYIPRDSTGVSDTLDVEVLAILDKPYDSEFEGKVTSKSNGQVGPGLRFAMTKSNVFRGADVLGVEADGSYEWQTGAARALLSIRTSTDWVPTSPFHASCWAHSERNSAAGLCHPLSSNSMQDG